MAYATKDKAGRPVIAVTGIGIITSLGTGKEDNWNSIQVATVEVALR